MVWLVSALSSHLRLLGQFHYTKCTVRFGNYGSSFLEHHNVPKHILPTLGTCLCASHASWAGRLLTEHTRALSTKAIHTPRKLAKCHIRGLTEMEMVHTKLSACLRRGLYFDPSVFTPGVQVPTSSVLRHMSTFLQSGRKYVYIDFLTMY